LSKAYITFETINFVVSMTCYFRHLGSVFKKAGVEVTSENRKQLDQIIQDLVGANHKNCPETWREVKKRIIENQDDFAAKLKAAWISRQRAGEN
jgi:hypothetical protein